MIERNLLAHLQKWKKSKVSLPLILRGARQVGKTTVINDFGKSYDQYLYFNLEKKEDLQLFINLDNLNKLVQRLFLAKGGQNSPKISTLIFIDEIQEKAEIIELLRYFKEEYAHLDVIVTGSLLEFGLNKITKIPVGRVEFMELHPLNFSEYLKGRGRSDLANALQGIPFDNELLPIFYNYFHEYAIIGGMPGIASAFIEENDITRVGNLFTGIVESYKEDVEKYARSNTQKGVIRHIMDTAPYEIDNRINLNHFGASSFKTREVKEAMGALSKARLLELIYPTTQTKPPIVPDFKKRPRLHFMDVGLINYQLGLHQELLSISNLHDSSRGKLVQQIVNQEIKSQSHLPSQKRAFWVREERGTSSEVDILFQFRSLLIPVEVKSGASGTLRSLHEFMDRCPHHLAIRIFGGMLRVDNLKTRLGKPYKLLNLPYFLSGEIEKYLEWFVD